MGKFRGIIVVDRERCKGYSVVACPLHILALTEKQVNKKVSLAAETGPEGFVQRMFITWRERCAWTDAIPYIKEE